MDIEDAFTSEAIANAGTGDPEMEAELRRIITMGINNDLTDAQLDLAVLCFVAGRTYQSDLDSTIEVSMAPELAAEFMLFLMERSRR